MGGVMDNLNRFVTWQNIAHFADQLLREPGEERRRILRCLLIEEESRLGVDIDRLEIAERKIKETTARIERQMEVVRRLRAAGQESASAEQLLRNLISLKGLFKDFRKRAAEALDRSRLVHSKQPAS